MSIKIYNAYQIKITSMQDCQTFIHILQSLCQKEIQNMLENMLANQIQETVDYAILYKKRPELGTYLYLDFSSYICSLDKRAKANPNQALYQMDSTIRESEKQENITTVLKKYYPVRKSKQVLKNKVTLKSLLNLNSVFNLEQTIAMFYQTPTDVCIIAYGDILCDILKKASYQNSIEELIKFQIVDFHYQNQTDKPNSISDEEWNIREKEWNRMLPSGNPSKDGIVFPVISSDNLDLFIYSISNDTLLKHSALKKEQRTKKLARKLIEEYCLSEFGPRENKTASDFTDAIQQLNIGLADSNSDIFKKYEEYLNILNSILPDITKEILSMNLDRLIDAV